MGAGVLVVARVLPQQHSEPYSTPALLWPLVWQLETQLSTVMLVEEAVVKLDRPRAAWLSVKQPERLYVPTPCTSWGYT